MPEQNNAALVREIYDAFNERDFDRTAELTAEDAELINIPTGETRHGPHGSREYMQGWVQAFPDARCEIINLIEGPDAVVVEFWGRGTHNGPLQGPGGDIAPTGRRVDVRFCDVNEVRNGKITRVRSYFDMATMMRQLGVLPEPAHA